MKVLDSLPPKWFEVVGEAGTDRPTRGKHRRNQNIASAIRIAGRGYGARGKSDEAECEMETLVLRFVQRQRISLQNFISS
jgi:hypothetical protein